MKIPRIYVNVPIEVGGVLELPHDPSNHVIRVLRMKVGERVILFNGASEGEYVSEMSRVEKNKAFVVVKEYIKTNTESRLKIHLGQGLSKGDRMDHAIQKAVELGVDEITPIITARCEVKLSGDRVNKKIEHLQKVIISACEQSGRWAIPKLNFPMKLDAWLSTCKGVGFVCDPLAEKRLSEIHDQPDHINLLIGPEGGLTEAEIELAQYAGLKGLYLGPRILRTETAPSVALALLQSCWGDF